HASRNEPTRQARCSRERSSRPAGSLWEKLGRGSDRSTLGEDLGDVPGLDQRDMRCAPVRAEANDLPDGDGPDDLDRVLTSHRGSYHAGKSHEPIGDAHDESQGRTAARDRGPHRSVTPASSSAMRPLSAASEKKGSWRRRARDERPTTRTATSTFALSRAFAGLAGRIAAP